MSTNAETAKITFTNTPISESRYEAHELATIFPQIDQDDLIRLTTDIKQKGQLEPIWLYQGKILDGRTRYEACRGLGIKPCFREYEGSDPTGFVISMNLHRRHLTPQKKRELIETLLKASPNASDRAIAEQARVSPTTVGEVRRETTVQCGQSATRIGQDGKARKAPSGKGEISKRKMKRELDVFLKKFEGLEDWQQRSFVKQNKERLSELIEEVENEDNALSPELGQAQAA